MATTSNAPQVLGSTAFGSSGTGTGTGPGIFGSSGSVKAEVAGGTAPKGGFDFGAPANNPFQFGAAQVDLTDHVIDQLLVKL